MIESQQDVPDAFMEILPNLTPHCTFTDRELLSRCLLAEYGGRGDRPVSQPQQSFMLGIQIEQEPVVSVQGFYWNWTGRGKEENRVGSVCVVVDQMACGVRRTIPPA